MYERCMHICMNNACIICSHLGACKEPCSLLPHSGGHGKATVAKIETMSGTEMGIERSCGRFGRCRKCNAHRPGSWRRCPVCHTWCGAGCEPERCWGGGHVNLCPECLRHRILDRVHAQMVVSQKSIDARVASFIFHFIG